MSPLLQKLLEKIDAGWTSAPLEPAEDLRRRKLIIETLLGKMLDAAPGPAAAVVKRMQLGDTLDELKPWIRDISKAADDQWPGISATVEKLIEEYDRRVKLVPGATSDGGAS